jgi:large subunit ribosomal protein L24
MVKRTASREQANPQGGIIQGSADAHVERRASPIPRTARPTRVGFEVRDGKKVRVAVKSGETSMADKYTPRLKHAQYDERSSRR